MPKQILPFRLSAKLIWAAASIVMVLLCWNQIATGLGWGPDDQLRQLQLRDWLAGQSWFDTVQYRIGGADSQPMHWSRLIELPLAFFVLILKPFLGTQGAEIGAMVLGPLLTLACFMGLVYSITMRVFDRKTALVALFLALTSIPIIAQIRPMRIDHHGWQIVLALLALRSMFVIDKKWGGLCLGGALALWLNISLEGLPLSAALIIYLCWRWAYMLDAGARLFWAFSGFLLTAFGLHWLINGGFELARIYCDIISLPLLLSAFTGGGTMLLALRFVGAGRMPRFAALAAAGGVSIVTLYLLAPVCLGGTFADMDPVVHEYWYLNVREGLPAWNQAWRLSLMQYGGVIIGGLVALLVLLRGRFGAIGAGYRTQFMILAYAFLWSCIVALLVNRASSVAAAYGLPLMAWLVILVFKKARAFRRPVTRIIATVSIVLLIAPGPFIIAAIDAARGEEKQKDKTDDGSLTKAAVQSGEMPKRNADGEEMQCNARSSMVPLTALPGGNIVAPFDFGPPILLQTSHHVLATSHHRNDQAMADHIRIFTEEAKQAREILQARDIDYVIACEDEEELAIYAKKQPGGFWVDLKSGKNFKWLQRVYLKNSALMVWRISPDIEDR